MLLGLALASLFSPFAARAERIPQTIESATNGGFAEVCHPVPAPNSIAALWMAHCKWRA